MRKSRYTGEQLAFALKQAELGMPVAEVSRKMAVSEVMFFCWNRSSAARVRSSCGSFGSSKGRTRS